MSKASPVKVGKFEGFSWIRCEGKGSFLNSPAVKKYGEKRIEEGESLVVVDLEECTGMDSTFMGILAGLATKLSAVDGKLQIAGAGEKSTNSLEDLGLDFFMEINPEGAAWESLLDQVRSELTENTDALPKGSFAHGSHVLEAHEILAGASEVNRRKFAGVVDLLKGELGDRKSRDSE